MKKRLAARYYKSRLMSLNQNLFFFFFVFVLRKRKRERELQDSFIFKFILISDA